MQEDDHHKLPIEDSDSGIEVPEGSYVGLFLRPSDEDDDELVVSFQFARGTPVKEGCRAMVQAIPGVISAVQQLQQTMGLSDEEVGLDEFFDDSED